jgi:hypothetical protein
VDADLAALRALVLSDEDLTAMCVEVLTVLAHGERLVETLSFNEVDVTVDRSQRAVVFQGVLSINDERVHLSQERFVELASSVAEPLSGEMLTEWQKRRDRPAWPMPPASG